jgi:DNA repair protein RadC
MNGIMENKETMTAVREVVVQYRGPRFAQRTQITEAREASAFVRKLLPDNSREHFVILYLDGAHTIIGYSRITGIANACPVHPREVFQPAILLGSAAVLVSHNHPTGHIKPSEEDNKVTESLRAAGGILGVKLLDHVILGDSDSMYSYADEGLLK